jgi:putative transposase
MTARVSMVASHPPPETRETLPPPTPPRRSPRPSSIVPPRSMPRTVAGPRAGLLQADQVTAPSPAKPDPNVTDPPSQPSSALVLRRPYESTQYCSADYQAELRNHDFLISMSGKGNGSDNAMVETFFKTLQSELVWRTMFETRRDTEQAIGRYIDGFYNPIRRHSALDFTSPAQFEEATVE